MQKSVIDLAIASSLDAIAAKPEVRAHVGGKLGAMMKGGAAAFAFAAVSLISNNALAQQQGFFPAGGANNIVSCAVGGLAGGLLGHQAGGGHGKTALEIAGAIGGCKVAEAVVGNASRPQPAPGQVGIPARLVGQSAPLAQGGVHPMANYAGALFAQLNGQIQPTQPLPPEKEARFKKVLANAEAQQQQLNAMQASYAQAVRSEQIANGAAGSLEARIDANGSGALLQQSRQAQYQADRVKYQAMEANKNFGGAAMMVTMYGNELASQGYDIRWAKDQVMSVVSQPMLSTVTMTDPRTNQRVSFDSGVRAPMPIRGAQAF